MGRHWAPDVVHEGPPVRVPRLFDKQSITCLSLVFGVMLLLGTLAALRDVDTVTFPRAMPAFLSPPPEHPFTQPPVDAGVTAAYPRVLADSVRELAVESTLPIGSVIVEASVSPPRASKELRHEARYSRALDAPKPRQGGHDVRPRPRPGHGQWQGPGDSAPGGQHPRPHPGSGHGGGTVGEPGHAGHPDSGLNLGDLDGWLLRHRLPAGERSATPARPRPRVEQRQHLPRVSHRDEDGGGGSSRAESVESSRRSVGDSDQKSGDEESSDSGSGAAE